MNFRTLELFCTIAQQRSFSRAAAAHGLTQSAVSQAIHQLEESLGVQLIDRSKRPLVLTAAGRKYLSGVRGLLRSYERLERDVRTLGQRLSGQITVGSIVSIGLSYMPEAKAEFAQRHPEVEVRTEFASNDRVFEMTAEGEVDFGLVSFPHSTKQLQYVAWQQEPIRLVCAAEHPMAEHHEIDAHQLQWIEMMGFDPQLRLRQEIDRALADAGVKVNYTMEFDNADSMVRAIQANRSIGFVPEAAVRRETANGTLRVVACRELRMTRPLGIIFPRSGRLSRAADEFGSLLLGRPLSEKKDKKKQGAGSGKLAAETAKAPDSSGTSVVA